jgi:hypothetical protein
VNSFYQRAYRYRGGTKGATGLDLYFADEPVERPLVLFHHIPKTAGTSLRHVINSNYPDAEFEVLPIETEELPDALAAWYGELWESLGDKRERLVCAAGHFASFFLPVVGHRPVSACTLLRDPVDRVMSRYFFFGRKPRWTLADLYSSGEQRRLRGGNFERGRLRAFFNGQSRTILQPFYDTDDMPLTTDERGCNLWRQRLFELMDEYFLVGVQERFEESIQAFGRAFGWEKVYPATARINSDRPPPEVLPPETVELVRRYNWLDCELHARHVDRIGRPLASPATVTSSDDERPEETPAGERRSGRGRGRGQGRGRGAGTSTNYAVMASRALRRAQRAWTSAGGAPNAEADFFVRSAEVMATLELARALRESAQGESSGGGKRS